MFYKKSGKNPLSMGFFANKSVKIPFTTTNCNGIINIE